jgi:hypothetical protein
MELAVLLLKVAAFGFAFGAVFGFAAGVGEALVTAVLERWS